MTFAEQMAKAQASQNSDSLMNPIKISNYFAQMVFGALKQK